MKKIITSLQNQEIKNLLKLKKSRERGKTGLILIEGRHEISMAAEANINFLKLFHCNSFHSDENFKVDERLFPQVYDIPVEIFEKISLRESPDGYIAIAKKPKIRLNELKLKKNPLIVILESLEKPGNIGAIIRSADAVGADAIIVADEKTDLYNPNTIRASLGAIFSNQILALSADELIEWLKINKITSYALAPRAKKLYTECDYTTSTAIIVGTEHEGVSDKLLGAVEHQIKIEMKGIIDSLNASVSTAVVLFEAARQRNLKA